MKNYGLLKACLAALLLLGACTVNDYESGDGEYSYLTADFGMVSINSSGQAVSFTTDADRELEFITPVTITGAKSDTVYRALVYFNETTTSQTTLRGFQQVLVCTPVDVDSEKDVEEDTDTDPVYWNSTWTSQNGSYVNLGLGILVGESDDDEATGQQVGFTMEDVSVEEGDAGSYNLMFRHAQNDVPEYYTSTIYVSVPLDVFQTGDTLNISVNTYDDGILSKTVIVP